MVLGFLGGGRGAEEDDCATVKLSPQSTKEAVSQWLVSTFPEWGQLYAAEFIVQEVDGQALRALVEQRNFPMFEVRWNHVTDVMHVLVSWLVT